MIEAGCSELLRAAAGEADGAGDEVGVHAQFGGGGDDLDEVAAQEWFAAGQVELQDAQLLGFGQDPLPLGGSDCTMIDPVRTRWEVRATVDGEARGHVKDACHPEQFARFPRG
jgi:hypothetical protein